MQHPSMNSGQRLLGARAREHSRRRLTCKFFLLVLEEAGNMLQVAVNRLLRGVKTRQANGIFATQNSMTASPLGSPTAESPQTLPAMTLEEWLMRHPQANHRKSGRKIKITPQSQIALPF